jgi:hypothetical protein
LLLVSGVALVPAPAVAASLPGRPDADTVVLPAPACV